MLQPGFNRVFVRLLVALALVASSESVISAEESVTDPLQGFQQYLDQLLSDFGVPGAAVAVVGIGPEPRVFVGGVTQAGGIQPITSATSFHIASVTKSFTAAIAALLVDDGVLEWDTPVRDVINSAPDTFQSGLWSSAADMNRWMKFFLDGGRHRNRALITTESFSEMWTPLMVVRRPYNPRRASLDAFGLGWRISTLHGSLHFSHGGGGTGSTSHIVIVPEKNLGIAVLTNTALNPIPDLAGNWILNRIFEIEGPDPRERAQRMVAHMAESRSAAHLQALEEKDPAIPPPHPLRAYSGTYSDFIYGDVEVGTDETGLTFAYHGVRTDVHHLHGNVFLFSSPLFDDLRSEFEVSPDGEATAVKVPIGIRGTEIVFRRRPAN